jgi:chemotaxis protein methyltransferase CheR
MPPFVLTPHLFSIFSRFIEERTGIHHEMNDTELLSGKVASRALEAGYESPLDYYYLLRYDDPHGVELDALIDVLVVNETYFYREASTLQALIDHHLAPLIKTGRRPRVWSAAASSGEEPLTLAMMLASAGLLERTDLVASDVSRRVLARARDGSYGKSSVRLLPPADRARWFVEEGARLKVRPELSDRISWRRVNLVDPGAVAALGSFDAILCRNALIYFSEQTVRGVVTSLTAALAPTGLLAVGAAESLFRFGTALRGEEHGAAFFYAPVVPS